MNPPELQNPKMNSLDFSRQNQKKKAKTHQQKNHQKEKNTN
jgi:hypothetical protein